MLLLRCRTDTERVLDTGYRWADDVPALKKRCVICVTAVVIARIRQLGPIARHLLEDWSAIATYAAEVLMQLVKSLYAFPDVWHDRATANAYRLNPRLHWIDGENGPECALNGLLAMASIETEPDPETGTVPSCVATDSAVFTAEDVAHVRDMARITSPRFHPLAWRETVRIVHGGNISDCYKYLI